MEEYELEQLLKMTTKKLEKIQNDISDLLDEIDDA
tara:strand:+ start:1466 stop:1570 length:105 start_codon:yes stop_codon:yes gene_type:complete